MKRKTWVLVLAVLGLLLLTATSVVSIVRDDGGRPYSYTSQRGASVRLYGGEGPYQHDTVAKAVLFRGFDWANLFVCLPIAVYGVVLHQRGRVRGTLLVAAVFTYLAYNYLIGVMGNAFNEMFFAWTAIFSIGIFGLATTIAVLDLPSIPRHLSARFPRRSLSVYLVVLSLFLMAQYLTEILASYSNGSPPPSLGMYTTLELAALELGIMIPLHFVAAALLWRRRPVGYLLGVLLVFTALMTFMSLLVAAFISSSAYDVGGVFDVAVPAVLTLVAAGFSVAVFAAVSDQPAIESAPSNRGIKPTAGR